MFENFFTPGQRIIAFLMLLSSGFLVHAQKNSETKEVCFGDSIILTVFDIQNEGVDPVYQWVINGVEISGANSISYSYYPNDGDVITCTLISNTPCAEPCAVSSNEITINVVSCCPDTVADEEGHVYIVTALSGLCWTENLRTTFYPGTNYLIPFAKPYTCAVCPSQLDTVFGLLYTWYAAMNIDIEDTEPPLPVHQGICPNGWHIPSETEWDLLKVYFAEQLKSTTGWLYPLGSGTDEFGFNALPAGWYNADKSRFEDMYGFAGWWASDEYEYSDLSAYYFRLAYYCDDLREDMKLKKAGLSVRCVMDY